MHVCWDQNDKPASFAGNSAWRSGRSPRCRNDLFTVQEKDSSISIASIYRSLGIFEDYQLIQKLDIGDGKARFEIKRAKHEHLMDVETGQIHEFKSQQLQKLIEEIASEMGFELTEHRLEIYGRKHGRTACRCYEIKVY